MQFLIAFCFSLLLLLLPVTNSAIAADTSIDDLLIPEDSSVNANIEVGQQLEEGPSEESNIDELLGPKDNFPFLPDNHRDSGTGKFNSF